MRGNSLRRVSLEGGAGVRRGAPQVQPKWEARIHQKFQLAKAFILEETLKSRPVVPTQIKKRLHCRTDVAKKLFELAINDPELLRKLKQHGKVIIRGVPRGVRPKKNP